MDTTKTRLPEVLLIDDDPILLSSTKRFLGLWREIDTADCGFDALAMMSCRPHPYSVIITDMRMPQMNGIELIQRARRISPASYYCMLTGNQDLQTCDNAQQSANVDHFIVKPCSPDDLNHAIEWGCNVHEERLAVQDECAVAR